MIRFDHEYGPREVLAPSWGAFLAQIAADCEAGVYYYDEEEEEPWCRRDAEEEEEEEEEDDATGRPDPLEGMDGEWNDMLAEAEREDGVPPGGYRPPPEPDVPSGEAPRR